MSLPERMIGIWTCRCPEADTVVDAPAIEEIDSPTISRPADTATLKSPPSGLEIVRSMSRSEDIDESTHEPT